MKTKFERETRYLVLKIKDIHAALSKEEIKMLAEIGQKVDTYHQLRTGRCLNCVCVESHWPEYEPTWAAIENRMMGQQHGGEE